MSILLRLLIAMTACSVLAACAATAPAPVEPVVRDAGRSSHSSGIAYRDGPIRVIKDAPVRVSIEGDPRLGSLTAKIGIVEFGDYECLYCRDFHRRQFAQLRKEYIDTGKAQFIYKDLPLRSHAQAFPAALAAGCAAAQGRFWDMHDALLARQGPLGRERYAELARQMRLDMMQFDACFDGQIHGRDILRDMNAARMLGLTGTPSFLIGTIEGDTLTVLRQARGVPDFEVFAREIEKLH